MLFFSSAPLHLLSAPPWSTAKQEKRFFASDIAGLDELPADLDESDDYIAIPHKNDLDLGKPLVMDFVYTRCPEEIDRVLMIFSRRGGLQTI